VSLGVIQSNRPVLIRPSNNEDNRSVSGGGILSWVEPLEHGL
jgi:hypothetical protein